MAFVKQYVFQAVTVDVYDDCYKEITMEQGAKRLEKALNVTSLAKNGCFRVSVKKYEKDRTKHDES